MKREFITKSADETRAAARSLAPLALERGHVCLEGDLGAGKTVFTYGLVEELCPECLSLVHSPTFAIVNEYIGQKHSVFHFDLYRIKTADDLYSTGFYDYEERGGVIVAEWSDLFDECFPADSVRVRIESLNGTERKITVEYED